MGIALPFSVVTVSDAVVAFWMNPGLPDLAQRTWWFIRDQMLDLAGGRAEVGMRGWDTLDPGNYTLNNPGYTLAKLVLAAREMGDTEAADAVQAKLEERTEVIERDGVPRYRRLSTYANVASILARLNRESAMRDLIQHGLPERWRTGPVLAEAAYPDVLVARAVSDGHDLDLVLRPGDGARRVALGVERLVPGRDRPLTVR